MLTARRQKALRPQQLSAAGPGTGKAPGPAHPAPNPPQLWAPRAYRGLLPPPAGLLALVYGGRPPGRGGTQGGDVTARARGRKFVNFRFRRRK